MVSTVISGRSMVGVICKGRRVNDSTPKRMARMIATITVTGYRMQKAMRFIGASSVAEGRFDRHSGLILQRFIASDHDPIAWFQRAIDHLNEPLMRASRFHRC